MLDGLIFISGEQYIFITYMQYLLRVNITLQYTVEFLAVIFKASLLLTCWKTFTSLRRVTLSRSVYLSQFIRTMATTQGNSSHNGRKVILQPLGSTSRDQMRIPIGQLTTFTGAVSGHSRPL